MSVVESNAAQFQHDGPDGLLGARFDSRLMAQATRFVIGLVRDISFGLFLLCALFYWWIDVFTYIFCI